MFALIPQDLYGHATRQDRRCLWKAADLFLSEFRHNLPKILSIKGYIDSSINVIISNKYLQPVSMP